jgi:hypothetical protein
VPIAMSVVLRAQGGPLSSTFTNWVDHPAIGYPSARATDPVSQLNGDLQPLASRGGRLNWPSLAGRFDTSGYRSTHSDIVALMVFEHQMSSRSRIDRPSWRF